MENAKFSTMPRYWAMASLTQRGYMIFDRDKADKYIAFMGNDGLCNWHDKDYWDVSLHVWREAMKEAGWQR